MPIQTIQINDFSTIPYDDRRDFDTLFNLLKEFVNNGGNLNLPIKTTTQNNNIDLITLKEFITKHIDNSEEFITKLNSEALIENPFKMIFNKNTNNIELPDGMSIRDLRIGIDKHPNLIIKSIDNLIRELPSDYKKINGIEVTSYDNRREVVSKRCALFDLADQINHPKVYELIINSFPDIKSEWSIKTGDDQPYFVSKMECRWNECGDYPLTKLFYRNGIATDFINNNNKLCQDLVRCASKRGDIEFLKEILPVINLKKEETGLPLHNLSLSHAKNRQTAEILIKNGAVVETTVESRDGRSYDVCAYFSDSISDPEVLDEILTSFPKISSKVKDTPQFFYDYYKNKNPGFIKILTENHNFPIDKFDTLELTLDDESYVNTFLKIGMDTRINSNFCSTLVKLREAGLKILRHYNKSGYINSNSPEIIYNILRAAPTKSFLNYITKFGDKHLNALTIEGNPAWWGATNLEHLQFCTQNGADIMLSGANDKPYIYHLFEAKFDKRNSHNLFNHFIKKQSSKDANYKLNTNWTNNEGDNIFHNLMKVSRYTSEKINKNVYEILKNQGDGDIYKLINTKNNLGISPLENLLNTEVIPTHDMVYIINDILDNHRDNIKFSETLSDGSILSDRIKLVFSDYPEIKTKVEVLALSQELKQKDTSTNKRLKI